MLGNIHHELFDALSYGNATLDVALNVVKLYKLNPTALQYQVIFLSQIAHQTLQNQNHSLKTSLSP